MKSVKRHYVRFFSPGTFVAEESQRPIDEWSIVKALELANGVVERHNAKPYALQFVTMLEPEKVKDEAGNEFDCKPKELSSSALHHINGRLRRFDEVPDTKGNSILRSNMRCNRWPHIVETSNSWRNTVPLGEGECVVNLKGEVIAAWDDPKIKAYREKMIAEWDAQSALLTGAS